MHTWQYCGTLVVKLILKRNMTIGYVKESDYREKDPPEQLKIQGK